MNYDNLYDKYSKVSTYWYNHASDLKASAAAVHYSLNKDVGKEIVSNYYLGTGFSMDAAVTGIWKMLAGMSLELLYKAIYVKRCLTVPKSHVLKDLNDKLKIVLPKEFYPMLEIFTEHIIWDSKYPIPLNKVDVNKNLHLYKKHLMTEVLDGGKFKIRRNNGFLCWENYNRLWEIILDIYVTEKNIKTTYKSAQK